MHLEANDLKISSMRAGLLVNKLNKIFSKKVCLLVAKKNFDSIWV